MPHTAKHLLITTNFDLLEKRNRNQKRKKKHKTTLRLMAIESALINAFVNEVSTSTTMLFFLLLSNNMPANDYTTNNWKSQFVLK